jgi:hypothetical protein
MPARARSLPADVVGLLLSGSGVLTVRAAVAAGVSAERVHRLARAGLLERVGDGAYASSQQLVEANPWVAHAIRTRGFVQSRRKPSLAAGWSAVAVRRLPALRAVPPALPTAVQLDPVRRGTDTTPYGVVRLHDLDEIHHAQYAGCPTVGRAWLAVDLARAAPRPDALVVADAVLHGGTTVGGLRRALAHMTGWPGTDAAAWVVEHADGGAESPLESLGRLAFIEYGLPVPLSNVWVGNGWPEYRVDHLWPWHWVAGEADGAGKYRSADDPFRVVAGEKDREAYLRRVLGLDVGRYGWSLAMDRPRLGAHFAAILAANPPRAEPVQWWPYR